MHLKAYNKYGKYKKDDETLLMPSQKTSQSSDELPEFNAEFMRASIEEVLDKMPDSMPQWIDVPTEVGQDIATKLKAMSPDVEAFRQGGFAQYSKKQARELIDLMCKTCLEAALKCKRASV